MNQDPGLETATFGAGCFWCVEETFHKTRGVVKTRVGYSGGHTDNPTYKDVCAKGTGHAEVCEVTYDPAVIAYDQLLSIFFRLHDAGSPAMQGANGKGQYRSVIFYHDDSQHARALQAIRLMESRVHTELTPAAPFWEAEAYHQKYYCRHGG